jgi:hypothetical protein
MSTPSTDSSVSWIAFDRDRRLAMGRPATVAAALWHHLDANPEGQPLTFDAVTGHPVEIDVRGSLADTLARLAAEEPLASPDDLPAEQASESEPPPAQTPSEPQPRGRGRPRLGVVAREVTLLPRHWSWLAAQPGGASVALRKLVEGAIRDNRARDARRVGQEALYRFMSAMAGNAPGFEAASRALFAGDRSAFEDVLTSWPTDVRLHCLEMAQDAFAAS